MSTYYKNDDGDLFVDPADITGLTQLTRKEFDDLVNQQNTETIEEKLENINRQYKLDLQDLILGYGSAALLNGNSEIARKKALTKKLDKLENSYANDVVSLFS